MYDTAVIKTAAGKPEVREEILRYGPKKMRDIDLIMLLLGTGTKKMPVAKLAKQVLSVVRERGDEQRLDAPHEIDGVGPSKAAVICAALELGRRYNSYYGKKIGKPNDVVPLLTHYTLQPQEHFICVSLNGANEIIKIRVITIGTLNRSLIHPREIFCDAITDRAASIILCHNHPSGSLDPSVNDIEVTARLEKSAELLGIRILDHIIISGNGYTSFLERGLLEPVNSFGD